MKKVLLFFGIPIAILMIFIIIGAAFNNISLNNTNPNALPGMFPVDVYLNMKKKGYKIDKQFSNDNGNFWYCTKTENDIIYNVQCYSSDAVSVEKVRCTGTILGSKNVNVLMSFLTMCATFPYKNNNPELAKEWVYNNFNKEEAKTIINGVSFTLIGRTKFVRMLDIEKAK